MNPPLKKPLSPFWPTPPPPPPPSKYEIVQAPLLLLQPRFMRKVLVSPPFFTKSCFMKPIVRSHEIIVFRQDLTTAGSSKNHRINIKIGFHW